MFTCHFVSTRISYGPIESFQFLYLSITRPRKEFFNMLFYKQTKRSVLFTYCYRTHTSKLHDLKQHSFTIYHSFVDKKFMQGSAGQFFSCGVYKGHLMISPDRLVWRIQDGFIHMSATMVGIDGRRGSFEAINQNTYI